VRYDIPNRLTDIFQRNAKWVKEREVNICKLKTVLSAATVTICIV